MLSSTQIQAQLMRDYYQFFSKYERGHKPNQKIAWVTSFTPIEILEALDIQYIYPESYAAVIAASGKEKELLEESYRRGLCKDCCSYSSCFEGALCLGKGPRGVPPKPDILIATNNQCNTLPNWWNILADRYKVPLYILDYPGELLDEKYAYQYVAEQHKKFIFDMEKLSGNKIQEKRLSELVEISKKSVHAWKGFRELAFERDVPITVLFDAISFLITSRCKPETELLYKVMTEECREMEIVETSRPAIFWLGYPLWYHENRYLSELLSECRICGSNYITWWELDYSGDTTMEQLYRAYNGTFLNLSQTTRTSILKEILEQSKADGIVTLHNKSCKCDFVSARDIALPQAEIDIDMIERNFIDINKAKRQIDILLENICTR